MLRPLLVLITGATVAAYAFIMGGVIGRHMPDLYTPVASPAITAIEGFGKVLFFSFWPTIILVPAIVVQVSLRFSWPWMTAILGLGLVFCFTGFEFSATGQRLLSPVWEAIVGMTFQVLPLAILIWLALHVDRKVRHLT